jgi:hypothetical protein
MIIFENFKFRKREHTTEEEEKNVSEGEQETG